MMNKTISLASLLSMTVLASAESPQIFVGAKGGYQWASDDNYNQSDPRGSLWGIYSGLRFTPSWRWDVGYQYHDDLKAEATSVNVKTWLIESALRYDWYLQDNLSLYGRLGAAYWDMEKTPLSLDNLDGNSFSPLGEIGISYYMAPSLSLSAGYQYIDSIGKSNTGKYDSHAALISLSYTFGRKPQSAPIEMTPVVESTPVPEKEVIDSKPQPQTSIFSEKIIEGRFGFDVIKPSDHFVQSLSEVVSVLKAYPQAQAVIVGHADSTGAETYNQTLSEHRAQAVASKLVNLGVTPGQLEWRGEGESNPVADNATAEGRAQNRRVEVTIKSFQFEEQTK